MIISSHFLKATEDMEARETLALIAARGEDQAPDGETYIEKYTRGIAQVESILVLDRLRQVCEFATFFLSISS